MIGIKRFFDLYYDDRTHHMVPTAGGDSADLIAGWRQGVLYVAATLGVFLGPFVPRLVKQNDPTFWEVMGSSMNVISSLLFGAVVLAIVFKTKSISAKTPFVIQTGVAGFAGLASGTVIPLAISQVEKLLFA